MEHPNFGLECASVWMPVPWERLGVHGFRCCTRKITFYFCGNGWWVNVKPHLTRHLLLQGREFSLAPLLLLLNRVWQVSSRRQKSQFSGVELISALHRRLVSGQLYVPKVINKMPTPTFSTTKWILKYTVWTCSCFCGANWQIQTLTSHTFTKRFISSPSLRESCD